MATKSIVGEKVGMTQVWTDDGRVVPVTVVRVQPGGIGRRLVDECIAFARAKGYRKLVLWTQSDLDAARAIYRSCGFRLVKTEKHGSFGIPLTGEYWELRL